MPQPIDLQTETARLDTVQRIQQITDRASLAAQHRVTAAEEQQRVIAETLVHETPQSQSEEIDAEMRRRNPFAGRRRRRPREAAAEEAKAEAPEASEDQAARADGAEPHILDVTI